MKWCRLPPLCVQLSTFVSTVPFIYIYIYIYIYILFLYLQRSEVIGKEEKQYLKKKKLHFFIRDFLWGIFQEVIVLFITAVGSRSSLWAHIFSWTVLVEWVVRGKHVFWAFTQIAKTCIWGPFPCDDVGMQEAWQTLTVDDLELILQRSFGGSSQTAVTPAASDQCSSCLPSHHPQFEDTPVSLT